MSVLDRPLHVPSGEATRGLRRALALAFTVALIALAILLPVMQNSDEAAQGYRIRSLQQQKADLDAQIYRTQSSIAQLGSLARVDSEARNRLGMIPATREVAVAVDVPQPSVRPLPNRYLPPPASPPSKHQQSLWQRLVRASPFS